MTLAHVSSGGKHDSKVSTFIIHFVAFQYIDFSTIDMKKQKSV